MLISEKKFQCEYGQLYKRALRESEDYVAHPDKLREELQLQKKKRNPIQLRTPEADPYAYRMINYRGFVRFPDRLKNFVIAKNEPRSDIRSYLPIMLDIEPVSRCNFRCIMCTVRKFENGKRANDLSLAVFKQFIESQPQLIEVKLQGIGEPLLHKDFFDMVRFVRERDIWLRTTVNGSLLHVRDNYRRLIDSGVGEVQISFDGATKEVFERIRINSDFEQIVRNVTKLNEYANTKDRRYTRMWVLVQDFNHHQIFEFLELAKQMGFTRLTYSMNLGDWGRPDIYEDNRSRQAQHLTPDERQQLAETALRYGIEVSIWGSTDKYTTESPQKLCAMPFDRAFISSDLRVVPCGGIGNPEVADFGDAKDFQQVWNGPIYRAFRQAHLYGNIPQYCRNCYDLPELRRLGKRTFEASRQG